MRRNILTLRDVFNIKHTYYCLELDSFTMIKKSFASMVKYLRVSLIYVILQTIK